MHFRFESNQEYQLDAISAIVDLLDGQPRIDPDLVLAGAGFAAVSNRLDLDEEALVANLRTVQKRNHLREDEALGYIEEPIQTVEGEATARFPNFSVEMETGTGKTYVYVRAALDLFQHYGLRKFIIVVPSVAIREGVLKTLDITRQHLRELYDNVPYRHYVYDSGNLNAIRQFALSDAIELLVMTIDSFSRDESNIIYQDIDRFQGERPIHLLQATRPVIILDEPQNMESEGRIRALAALNPLFALRYSATHRNPYNLIYRLTPLEAYRQNLVKRIEVAGVERGADANQVFIRLHADGIMASAKTVKARLAVHKLMKGGAVKERIITVKAGDSLRDKTGLPLYEGFDVDEITPEYGIRFTNDVEIQLGDERGADRDEIFETQIRYTIEQHFIRQRRLRERGVKVLSLFFIDRVDNYAAQDGIIRVLFEKAFDELKARFEEWKDVDASSVLGAYFAQKRRKRGEVEQIDTSGTTDADCEAYDLIMRDKERLLSFEEPVAFLFSHSALREGWDNPNVFQICTLNQTGSEMRKRQEVGRGVRLAVNQDGERLFDLGVNTLTVVANESYESYVRQLQAEIEEEYGEDGIPPPPPNAREKATVRLRKEAILNPEFAELWERIKHKTRYAVRVDTAALIEAVVPQLDTTEIKPLKIVVRKAAVTAGEGGLKARQTRATQDAIDLSGRQPPPNLIDSLAYLLEQSTPPIRLTRKTLYEIFAKSENKEAALANPHEWSTTAHRILREQLADQLVDAIKYEKVGDWYEMRLFEEQDEIETWKQHLVPVERTIYDHVVYQSNVERRFVEDMEAREDVKLYLKLPNWFRVPTPVGEYNPDWALLREELGDDGQPVEHIYLVAETKGTTEIAKLRPSEQRKIKCGKKHFEGALGVDYKVVTSAAEI
jgi:type III restriction enzyme